LQLLRVKA